MFECQEKRTNIWITGGQFFRGSIYDFQLLHIVDLVTTPFSIMYTIPYLPPGVQFSDLLTPPFSSTSHPFTLQSPFPSTITHLFPMRTSRPAVERTPSQVPAPNSLASATQSSHTDVAVCVVGTGERVAAARGAEIFRSGMVAVMGAEGMVNFEEVAHYASLLS